MAENNRIEENITVFRNYTLPETGMKLAGYSALIHTYDLAGSPFFVEVPVLRQMLHSPQQQIS